MEPRPAQPEESPITPGRSAAAAAIWSWRSEDAPAARPVASPRRLLLLRALVAYGIGLVVFGLWSRVIGGTVLGLATLVLLAGLLSPRGAGAALDRLFRATGLFVRRILTWLLLVPIFYLILFPFGLLLRRGRRDRLQRRLEPDSDSYWQPLSGPTGSSSSLERQY